MRLKNFDNENEQEFPEHSDIASEYDRPNPHKRHHTKKTVVAEKVAEPLTRTFLGLTFEQDECGRPNRADLILGLIQTTILATTFIFFAHFGLFSDEHRPDIDLFQKIVCVIETIAALVLITVGYLHMLRVLLLIHPETTPTICLAVLRGHFMELLLETFVFGLLFGATISQFRCNPLDIGSDSGGIIAQAICFPLWIAFAFMCESIAPFLGEMSGGEILGGIGAAWGLNKINKIENNLDNINKKLK